MTESVLLTEDQVAARLRRSKRSIARLRAHGKLAYIPGRPVRITEDELERYIRREAVRTMPPPKALKPPLDISAKARDIAIAMRHGGRASMAWIRRVDPKD